MSSPDVTSKAPGRETIIVEVASTHRAVERRQAVPRIADAEIS